MKTEPLEKAAASVGFLTSDLRDAVRGANPLECHVIGGLIAQAVEIGRVLEIMLETQKGVGG